MERCQKSGYLNTSGSNRGSGSEFCSGGKPCKSNWKQVTVSLAKINILLGDFSQHSLTSQNILHVLLFHFVMDYEQLQSTILHARWQKNGIPKVEERVYLIKSTNPYHNCILEKNNLNWNTFSWGQKLASMIILVFRANLMNILSL